MYGSEKGGKGGKGGQFEDRMMDMMGQMMHMMTSFAAAGASYDGDWSEPSGAAKGKSRGPKRALGMEEVLIGDWTCPACGDHQFAKNETCRLCGEPKPLDDTTTYGPAVVAKQSLMDSPYTRNLLADVEPCTYEEAEAFLGANPVAPVAQQRFLALPPQIQRVVMNKGTLDSARDKTAAFISRMATVERLIKEAPGKGGASLDDLLGRRFPNDPSASSSSKGKGQSKQQVTPGDWFCPGCNDHQFSRNMTCRQCGIPKPEDSFDATEAMKQALALKQPLPSMQAFAPKRKLEPGDWICAACGDHQFARNQNCRKCGGPKTADAGDASGRFVLDSRKQQGVGVGDWYCPGCGDHNFARNVVCRKCGTPKPNDAAGGTGNIAGQASPSQPQSQDELFIAQLASQLAAQQAGSDSQMQMALLMQQLQLQQAQQAQLGGGSGADSTNQLLVAQMMGMMPQTTPSSGTIK